LSIRQYNICKTWNKRDYDCHGSEHYSKSETIGDVEYKVRGKYANLERKEILSIRDVKTEKP